MLVFRTLYNVLCKLSLDIIKNVRKPLRFGVKEGQIDYIEKSLCCKVYIHNWFLLMDKIIQFKI